MKEVVLTDWELPEFDICNDPMAWKGFVQLKRKGVRLRAITEVTPDNIPYVKQIMEIFEVRHLKEIRSNFAIIDKRECLIHSHSQKDRDHFADSIIFSPKLLPLSLLILSTGSLLVAFLSHQLT